MVVVRGFLFFLLALCVSLASAQEMEVRTSSATDASVRIDRRKRYGLTSAPKDRPRFTQKTRSGAVDVRDKNPKVVKFKSKKQKRTNRARLKGK